MAETITLIDNQEKQQVVDGEIPIIGFTSNDEKCVRSTLQKLCVN